MPGKQSEARDEPRILHAAWAHRTYGDTLLAHSHSRSPHAARRRPKRTQPASFPRARPRARSNPEPFPLSSRSELAGPTVRHPTPPHPTPGQRLRAGPARVSDRFAPAPGPLFFSLLGVPPFLFLLAARGDLTEKEKSRSRSRPNGGVALASASDKYTRSLPLLPRAQSRRVDAHSLSPRPSLSTSSCVSTNRQRPPPPRAPLPLPPFPFPSLSLPP